MSRDWVYRNITSEICEAFPFIKNATIRYFGLIVQYSIRDSRSELSEESFCFRIESFDHEPRLSVREGAFEADSRLRQIISRCLDRFRFLTTNSS
jgi:hypothetical protein